MPNHECTPECIAELEGLAEEAESRANELACTLHRERDELSALRSRVEELEARQRWLYGKCGEAICEALSPGWFAKVHEVHSAAPFDTPANAVRVLIDVCMGELSERAALSPESR
jgi:hypothetical protein